MSKALYDKISKNDFRKKSFLSPDQNEWTSGTYRFAPSGEWLDYFFYYNAMPYTAIKFRPAQGECVDYNIGNAADHPLMRVEEMYFIEMEAYAGMGNLAGLVPRFSRMAAISSIAAMEPGTRAVPQ